MIFVLSSSFYDLSKKGGNKRKNFPFSFLFLVTIKIVVAQVDQCDFVLIFIRLILPMINMLAWCSAYMYNIANKISLFARVWLLYDTWSGHRTPSWFLFHLQCERSWNFVCACVLCASNGWEMHENARNFKSTFCQFSHQFPRNFHGQCIYCNVFSDLSTKNGNYLIDLFEHRVIFLGQ